MAINRQQYPVTYDEMIDTCKHILEDIISEVESKQIIGDTRGEVLCEVIKLLEREKEKNHKGIKDLSHLSNIQRTGI